MDCFGRYAPRNDGGDATYAARCIASGTRDEKREGLRSPPLCRCRSCRATDLSDIPTPPRATTKLFDATCALAGPWRKPAKVRADGTRFDRSANRIVNLTLTPQTPGQTGAKAPAAWTLQDLSCTTHRGRAVRESGTDVSLHAGAQVRAFTI
jgi:hypothetical protein